MPGGMHTDGTEELAAMLDEMGKAAPGAAAMGLYDGAAVVADAYHAAVGQIQTEPFRRATSDNPRLASPAEKAALNGVTGIAKFQKNGSEVNTIVGAAEGYTTVAGQRKAVKVLARSINSGTSFMKKQPVFRKAQRTSKEAAQAAMIRTISDLMEKIIH